MLGVVQAVDIVSGFREKMRMPALPAGNIENSRIRRQLEDFEKSRNFLAVALEFEDRLVFEEVVRVEISLPPLGFLFQKNTGSR